MNIQRLAATAARIGMRLAGSPQDGGAKELVTLHLGAVVGGVYDPTTDTTSAAAQVDVALEVFVYERENKQQPGDTEFSPYMEQMLVEAADLPAGREIVETDTVTRADGDVWALTHVARPPGKAIYILDVRK